MPPKLPPHTTPGFKNSRRIAWIIAGVVLAAMLVTTLLLWHRARIDAREINQVESPQILYLKRDTAGQFQLFATSPEQDTTRQLTQAEGDVWDYAISPDGAAIAYSVVRKDKGADLWRITRNGEHATLLLTCPEASCTWPSWSADGTQIAYERQDLSETVIGVLSGPTVSRVWLLDVTSGETTPLFETETETGNTPTWSPTGRKLAYISSKEAAVHIYDLDKDALHTFPTLAGMGSWAPNGTQLVLTVEDFVSRYDSHYLVLMDLESGDALDISTQSALQADGSIVPDSSPAWSPSGEWIAFGRFALPEGKRTWGQQLWRMRPNGSEAQAWVTDLDANLGAFAWRSNGQALIYVRTPREMLADPHPEIWLVELDSKEPRLIVRDAVMARWLD